MLNFIVETILMLFVMLYAVPALTGGGVAVPAGGFLRALGALVVIGLLNTGLWTIITAFSIGGAILADYLTFGLVGLLVNALALLITARVAPSVLYVRSYWSAIGGAVVTTLASYLVAMATTPLIHALTG
jgi:uncharacterized membrane protein YvlD (DUF360 family)